MCPIMSGLGEGGAHVANRIASTSKTFFMVTLPMSRRRRHTHGKPIREPSEGRLKNICITMSRPTGISRPAQRGSRQYSADGPRRRMSTTSYGHGSYWTKQSPVRPQSADLHNTPPGRGISRLNGLRPEKSASGF